MAFDLLSAVLGDHTTALAPRKEGRQYGAGNTEYWGLFGLLGLPQTTSGVPITPESALRVSAVMACVRLISETFAQLPLHYYERLPNGKKRLADDDMLAQVVIGSPNLWQTGFEFRELMQAHVDLRGNAYGLKVAGTKGAVSEIVPLHPDRMTIERLSNGRLLYKFKMPDGSTTRYSQDEIFHVRNLSQDGVQGLSTIQVARDAVGLALASETHAAGLFKNGAQPGVILRHPGKLLPERARVLREDWERLHSGPYNSHRTAVLEEGMDATSLGLTNVDLQYLEGRKFQGEEICRVFRVPPHMVGFLDRSTFNNIVQMSLEFVLYSMMPRLRRWEEAMSRDFIEDPSRFYFKFDVEGLLRGDIETRFQAYAVGRQWGWLSIDDIREKEDMDPIGEENGGNVYLSPMNMTPAAFVEPTAQATLDKLTAPPPPPPEPSPTKAETEQAKKDAEEANAALAKQVSENTSLKLEVSETRIERDAAFREAQRAQRDGELKDQTILSIQQEMARKTQEISDMRAAAMAIPEKQSRIEALEEELMRLTHSLAFVQIERDESRRSMEAANDALRSSESRLRDERERCESLGLQLEFSNPLRNEVIATNRGLIEETSRRMILSEMEAARRACKKPNFIASIEQFFNEHEQRFCSAVDLPLRMYMQLTGKRRDPRNAIKAHLESSRRQLIETAGTATQDNLLERIEETIAAWESRAPALADEWTK